MLFPYLAMYVCCGLLFLGISVPLIRRRVPPNGWYGFRVPKTLNSPNIWYPVNEYSGRQMYRTGLLLVVVAFALSVVPGMQIGTYVGINSVVMIGDLVRGFLLTFRYLKSF